ncbi:MAG: hypothetical protein JKY08_05460 [Flavobacteriaceae bacterium]|nr:hypothetical protein [Flavobacteriaceae bacterium]
MAGKKQVPIRATLTTIRNNIDQGFSDVDNRLNALERSDAVNSMRIRDLEIQMRAAKGVSHVDIARDVDLTPGRISQIVRG